MQSFLTGYMARSAQAAAALAADAQAAATLLAMAATITAAFRAGGRLFTAGNGGSAGDSAHLAAEFLSRCHTDRAPLPAIALAANAPALTALANDYGVATLFARPLAALGRAGDVLLVLSTSGNSPNILAAIETAQNIGMAVLGFAGQTGGRMAETVPNLLRVPSTEAQIVQQLHMQAGHALLGLVEQSMFGTPA